MQSNAERLRRERRKSRVAVWAMAALAYAAAAGAQPSYPVRPIHFVSPNAPGGATTLLARLIGQKLTEAWGEAVVVENKPGGNGIIGGEVVAKAAPDGYTLLSISTTHVITPLLQSTPYDALADFTPVATLGVSEQLLVVHPSVPANTLQEFIALAKARPGTLNYASAGAGSSTHLAGELFNQAAGTRIQHIPYKGSGPALSDLIAGHVQMYFGPPSNILPYIQTGKLKALAIGGSARLASLPEVPTFAEAGLGNIDLKQWWGLIAPAHTPRPIVDKLAAEINRILATPDMRKRLEELGMEPYITTPDQFASVMKSTTATFQNVIRTSNIHVDN
jgi:tripartite-type tricarboxylate transporter receptor subunit TctC